MLLARWTGALRRAEPAEPSPPRPPPPEERCEGDALPPSCPRPPESGREHPRASRSGVCCRLLVGLAPAAAPAAPPPLLRRPCGLCWRVCVRDEEAEASAGADVASAVSRGGRWCGGASDMSRADGAGTGVVEVRGAGGHA